MQLAKTNNIAIFIVGHVTKEGTLAGPRMLEHMVDTVLYFEGERHHTFRILRAVKNRFGSTNEIGIFEMQSGGLVEVLNPSQVFLEERLDGATGSSIVVTMEGTRPILAEVQALVTPTMFGNAKRTTTGLDFNRASLIMAVLENGQGFSCKIRMPISNLLVVLNWMNLRLTWLLQLLLLRATKTSQLILRNVLSENWA